MSERLIIKDEVHDNIELEGAYKELVQSRDFQRLKDIVQTATAKIEYENLKDETRFDHSIGSYYLMCKMVENVEKKLEFQGVKVRKEDKEIAKIAMLLHDIGHGAYSHTLEKITGYSHEKRSIDIVKDKETQIHNILKKYYGENFVNKVGDFLERVYEHKKQDKPNNGIKIENGFVNLQNLLASFVSNNIDADRLDYLIRDSKKAGYKVLTEVDKLMESFEFVLDTDKVIVAIPEDKKLFLDMAILERARNYRDIYFCSCSVIGDHVLDMLLEELRENPKEVPNTIQPILHKFLINRKAKFSTQEYMQITDTPMQEALNAIRKTTKNEKLKELCDIENMTKSYQTLNTDKKEEYIRYLLNKAIPQISKDTKGIVEETRWIKPYKSNEHESINIITSNGIEDYKDIEQNLIKLDTFPKRTIAISEEMLRLELGVSREEFEKKYKKTVEEVISTVTKSKDDFELRYVLTKPIVNVQELKEKVEEKYKIVDSAKYMSYDVYYDNPETYEFLENKEALRIREGITLHESKETYHFKKTRVTYKQYRKDNQSDFTIRRKEEEIGDSTNLKDYTEFLEKEKINKEQLTPVLNVSNLRYLYTVNVNGILIDISFNTSYYKNEIYEMFGNVGTIEIKPRENKVCDRLSILQLRNFIEEQIPNLSEFLSNTNVYEIGMLDTYKKYKKGYIISEDVKEHETEHPKSLKKIEEIVEKAKQRKDFAWLNQIPKTEEKIECM